MRIPPPKSQNQRQFRNLYESKGWLRAGPRNFAQLSVEGSTFARGARRGAVAVPRHAHFVNGAKLAGPQNLAGLHELGHTALLGANLHDPLVLVLGSNDCVPFTQIVRKRLFHKHILAAVAGVDGHRHVPMVGRPDEHRIDIVAREQLVVVLRRECPGIGNPFRLLEGVVPNVANSRDPRPGHASEVGHQPAASSAGPDTPDIHGVVRWIGKSTPRGGCDRGRCEKIAAATSSCVHVNPPRCSRLGAHSEHSTPRSTSDGNERVG